ncbi:hypothetical protein SAMN05192569_102212 [Parageobacillus thermantarcticus]|uniref:Uncharacterized protein n=1 Tax=Parageobacillus thermantarcticus TaxID=186116 RepID=A0A1I0TD08_9BACL|nr:hypothetical protein SAMN05192569_102212 [Parageobacillus thermantarcticus]
MKNSKLFPRPGKGIRSTQIDMRKTACKLSELFFILETRCINMTDVQTYSIRLTAKVFELFAYHLIPFLQANV